MSRSHSVIEDELAAALPSAVAAQLLDLGLACNSASLAYRSALLAEEQADQALDTARHDDPAMLFRRLVAEEHTSAATDVVEQHLATYTVVAATYATAAATVAVAAQAGTLADAAPVKAVTPSVLLADPNSVVPVVDLPAGAIDDEVAAQLRSARQRVIADASNARASGVAAYYDGAAAAAARPDGDDDIELSEDVPNGLHAYAALLVEILCQLATDPPGVSPLR
jgi:hypothetical protein